MLKTVKNWRLSLKKFCQGWKIKALFEAMLEKSMEEKLLGPQC
jgi:hypothetical protein